MQNRGLYYKQDNWEIDQYTIKGFFSGGTWVINPQDIEYILQNNTAPNGNMAMYDMFIKTRNMPQPYFIGRYYNNDYYDSRQMDMVKVMEVLIPMMDMMTAIMEVMTRCRDICFIHPLNSFSKILFKGFINYGMIIKMQFSIIYLKMCKLVA